MKLNEALKAVAGTRSLPVGKRIALACGIEALHLKTFMEAHFALRFPGTRLALETGIYGDLLGNVNRAAAAGADAVAVVFEWGDLDPRLGLRSVGAWSGTGYDDVVAELSARLSRLAAAIERITERAAVAICPPTIPLTLAGWTSGIQISGFELALQHALATFLLRVAKSPRARVVHPARLEATSPVAQRHDPRSELAAGFPYRLPHASALAELLIGLLFPASPRKALVTDLDDTLWAGIVGEVGVDRIAWTQGEGAQIHGMYQLMLRQLADMGVLLGVASKNDPEVARAALLRQDLWLDGSSLFPVHAGWGPKSEAMAAILRSWNIAAQDVVFVDDSPMELDEVRQAHPGLDCLVFPRSDPARALQFFELLRDRFGRSLISRDDALRGASLRAAAAFETDRGSGTDPAAFIRKLEGVVSLRKDAAVDSQRALQLINKTNQFNLNGLRIGDAEFSRLLEPPEGFVLEAAYRDRYGSLGVVGLVAGRRERNRLVVLHWVLSCRAFSRLVEHHMRHAVLELAGPLPVILAYQRTARNGPMQLFLKQLGLASEASGMLVLAPHLGSALVEELPHQIVWPTDG